MSCSFTLSCSMSAVPFTHHDMSLRQAYARAVLCPLLPHQHSVSPDGMHRPHTHLRIDVYEAPRWMRPCLRSEMSPRTLSALLHRHRAPL